MRKVLCAIVLVALSMGAVAEYSWLTPRFTRRQPGTGGPDTPILPPPNFANFMQLYVSGVDIHANWCILWQANYTPPAFEGHVTQGVANFWGTPPAPAPFDTAILYIRFTRAGCYRFAIVFTAGPWVTDPRGFLKVVEERTIIGLRDPAGRWVWSSRIAPTIRYLDPAPWRVIEFVFNITEATPPDHLHFVSFEFRLNPGGLLVRAVIERLGDVGARPSSPIIGPIRIHPHLVPPILPAPEVR